MTIFVAQTKVDDGMNDNRTQIWTGDDLTDAEFSAITELLRERRQFDLGQYKDRCIRRRIAKRLRACEIADFNSYLNRLTLDSDELDTLLATISIHVSQFFRNPGTYQILEQKILPELIQQAQKEKRKKLTLWSAGCATGEEPYSLALLVDDLKSNDVDISVVATDISKPVLEIARKGIYDKGRLREVPPAAMLNYFVERDDGYQLIERIRQQVEFKHHNIMTAEEFPQVDLILCRNVMIYFTREEQEKILTRFASILPENGVLVLGRSETMTGVIRNYFKSEFPVERIYRRTAEPVKLSALVETA